MNGDGLVIGGCHRVVVVDLQFQVVGRRGAETGETKPCDGDLIADLKICDHVQDQGFATILVADSGRHFRRSRTADGGRGDRGVPGHAEHGRNADADVVGGGDDRPAAVVNNRYGADGRRRISLVKGLVGGR